MDIDWSKAPEGFPLWLEGTTEEHRKHSGWYRRVDGVFEGAFGGQWHGFREGQFFTVHRKPDDHCEHSHGNDQGCPECGEEFAPAWTGEGRPPVGTVCEAKMPPGLSREVALGWEWRKVEVVKSGMDGAENECLVFDLETTRPAWVDEFRPIRTPEQIAAEERETVVAQMLSEINYASFEASHYLVMAERLYDAGYRKQPDK
jgi:hypothetical protein